MIEKYEGYKAKCNKCGLMFAGDSDYEFEVQDTKKTLTESLIDHDWQVDGDNVLCEGCKNKP